MVQRAYSKRDTSLTGIAFRYPGFSPKTRLAKEKSGWRE